MDLILRFFLIAVIVLFPFTTFPDTLVLKSGKSLDGKIISENDQYIKMDRGGVAMTYWKDEIKTIHRSRVQESLPQQPVPVETKKQELKIALTGSHQAAVDFVVQLDEVVAQIDKVVVTAKKAAERLSTGEAQPKKQTQTLSQAYWDIIEKAKDDIAQQLKKSKGLHAPRGCGKIQEAVVKVADSAIREFDENITGAMTIASLGKFLTSLEKKLETGKAQYKSERVSLTNDLHLVIPTPHAQ